MDEAQPRRGGYLGAILVAIAVGGSAVGVVVYQVTQTKETAPADLSGFDLSQVSGSPQSAGGPASPRGPQSSLQMIDTGISRVQFGTRVVQSVIQKVAETFTQMVRGNEAKVVTLAQRYTRQHAIIRQYGKEWMSYPDLKKLNDDYMRDHDPVKFMRGVAASPNFAKIVTKYAHEPPLQAFVKEAMRLAPPGAMEAATNYLDEDQNAKKLVDNVGQNLGLPPGIMSGGAGGKVDEKAIMSSVMKGNPDLQKAAGDTAAPPSVAAPDSRK